MINCMLKIIVNADDLGISQGVNEAIAECFRMRYISSTTLMVNMDYADEAVEMANRNGW
ncbi:MAG: ChbG/HpnK family deacetylase, partial [Lachnospiraceae bacterium]|nr:ChbG/HpnK family deacetylase [Lachnospiraceae bacterium]